MHRHRLLRLLWCLLGAAAGIAVALTVVGPPRTAFVLASLGGSSVFLFGLTRAPAAQPRAVLGGHLSGAFFGVLAYSLLGNTLPAYALAVSSALGFMLLTRTVHPPAGANPVLMVYAQSKLVFAFQPRSVGGLVPYGRRLRLEQALPGSGSLSSQALGAFSTVLKLGWVVR